MTLSEIRACFHFVFSVWSRFADYGTMLKIEDWVLLPDGCSILTTVGMRRFQVLSRGETDGYDTAQIKFLADVPIHEQHIKGKH